MSIEMLDAKVMEYRELQSMLDEITAQMEAIKDLVKARMVEDGVEVLNGSGWKASWKNVTSQRFDSKTFKAENPDLYGQYSKPTVSTRFLLA